MPLHFTLIELWELYIHSFLPEPIIFLFTIIIILLLFYKYTKKYIKTAISFFHLAHSPRLNIDISHREVTLIDLLLSFETVSES